MLEHFLVCASMCALVMVRSFIRLIVGRRILSFILLLSVGQPLGSDTVPITAPTVATSESDIVGTAAAVTAASSSPSSSPIVILHEYSTNGKCEGLPFRQIVLTLGDCYEHHMEPDPFSIVKGTLFYAHRVSWLSPNNGLFYEQWGTGEGCDGPPRRFITTQSSSCFTIDMFTQFNLTFLSSYTNSLISTVSGSASESESESDLISHMNLHPDQVTVTYFRTSECNESSVLLGPDLVGAPRLGDCFSSLQHHCTPQGDEVIISAYLDDECSPSMLIRQTRWRTNTCIPTWMVRQGVFFAQPTWMRWSCPDRYLPSVQNRSNAEASISISDPNPVPIRPRVVPAPVTATVPVLSNPPQLNRTIQISCSDYGCTRNCQPYRGSFSANWSCSPSGLTTGWVNQRLRHANETSSDIMAGLLEPASEAACFFGSFYQCPQPVPISLQLNASALGGMIVEVTYRGDHCGVGHDYPSESELDSASDRGGYWRASLYAPYECYSQTNSVYAAHFRTGVVVVMKYAKPVVEGEPHCQRLLSIHYFPPNMCIQFGGMSYRWTRMESARGPTWAHPFRMDERNRLMTPLACSNNTSTPRPRLPDQIALADPCPWLKYDWVALWSYVPPIIEGPDEPNHHCAKPFKP